MGLDYELWYWLTHGVIPWNYTGNKIPKVPVSGTWALLGDEFPLGPGSGIVLDPNGSASYADLEANASGMAFWKKVMSGQLGPGGFNICDFVSDKWDQAHNPNVPGASRGSRFPSSPRVPLY